MQQLKNNPRYSFRKSLLTVHKDGVRDFAIKAKKHELDISGGILISIFDGCGDVVTTAAKDFVDYLFTSQGVTAALTKNLDADVSFTLLPCNNISAEMRMYCTLEIADKIKLSAYHVRGLAQGLYYLEQLMNQSKSPFLEKTVHKLTAAFSPRMVHSAYGLDMYPNEYLSHLTHSGIDAILLCVKGVNLTPSGYLDFNELCFRAAKYGIDVYAYSYLESLMHPDEEGATAFYDELYGSVFKSCPDLAGVVLVGESVLFPSRDEATNGVVHGKQNSYDIPSNKPSPGFYPSNDYPKLIAKIRDSARKYCSKADIVFWTYNWGWAPEKDRIALINALPLDISLLVTFEMFEKYPMLTTNGYCADYTLKFAGPGSYFLSEAEAAKNRGIKLYAMSNTAGKTWDFGCIPYQPMPNQWIKRYTGLLQAKKDYGLCGLMESHTYGLYPSFISKLANACFTMQEKDFSVLLSNVICQEFGSINCETIIKALSLWSEAINYFTPTNEDQYGAFRVGAAYPFCFVKKFLPKDYDYAMFGSSIVMPDYDFPYLDFSPPPSTRTNDEIAFLTKMKTLMDEGIKLLENLNYVHNQNIADLIVLGKYISITVQTGINAKLWNLLKTEIRVTSDKTKLLKLIENAKTLLCSEITNATAALPLVQSNSVFGYEPSMDYVGDEENILWKIKQVEYVRDIELVSFQNRLH